MKQKTTNPQKQQQPRRQSKDEIEILQHEAGSYYLLIEAIMQNKRLASEIVLRWLAENELILMPKSVFENAADAEMAAIRQATEERENQLKNLAR